jgi:hypothetical protein
MWHLTREQLLLASDSLHMGLSALNFCQMMKIKVLIQSNQKPALDLVAARTCKAACFWVRSSLHHGFSPDLATTALHYTTHMELLWAHAFDRFTVALGLVYAYRRFQTVRPHSCHWRTH